MLGSVRPHAAYTINIVASNVHCRQTHKFASFRSLSISITASRSHHCRYLARRSIHRRWFKHVVLLYYHFLVVFPFFSLSARRRAILFFFFGKIQPPPETRTSNKRTQVESLQTHRLLLLDERRKKKQPSSRFAETARSTHVFCGTIARISCEHGHGARNEKNNSRWQTNIYTNFSIETASRSRNAMSFLLRVRVQYVCVFLCEVYNRIDATTTRWNASL